MLQDAEVTMNVEKLKKLPIIDRRNPHKKYSEKEEKYLREVKTYEFMNMEEPGLLLKFPYGNARNKANIVLIHGGKYQLPRFLARYVEQQETPIWGWKPDGTGRMVKTKRGGKPRAQMREVYE